MRNHRHLRMLFLPATLLLLAATSAHSNETPAPAKSATEELTVQQIVDKANLAAYYQGADGRARVTMTITDSQGRERRKDFSILRWDEPAPEGAENPETYCGDQKIYVYFHLPADVNKMAYLVWKHTAEGEDDDRWLYLPSLDLEKRIAARDKRTSFAGSDFYYEDVSGRNVNNDDHELVDTTEHYYVVKHTPKDPEMVEFASYVTWIHKGTFLPIKVEFYDEAGYKLRIYDALTYEEIDGYPTITKARMKDLQSGGQTINEYREINYNNGVGEDIFDKRSLRRPPIKYLR